MAENLRRKFLQAKLAVLGVFRVDNACNISEEFLMSVKRKKMVNQPAKEAVAITAEPSVAPLSWYYYIIPPSVLAFLTLLFYLPSRHYDFQFDDIANITKLYDIRHTRFWDLFLPGHDGFADGSIVYILVSEGLTPIRTGWVTLFSIRYLVL